MSNYLTKEQVNQLNEKHGWFEFGDAQSDVSMAFAQDAIAMYLAATEAAKATGTAGERPALTGNDVIEMIVGRLVSVVGGRNLMKGEEIGFSLDDLVFVANAAAARQPAPVAQPHYRMSEKPTAWLHILPEGKFFNGAFSDNSQIIRDKDEADSECYFHGGMLTPLFTAEWTQAGLDYVNEKADELHKKIVGSQP